MKNRVFIQRITGALWLVLLLGCTLIYAYDMLAGDGDGINAKLGINPLTWLVHGSIWLGLVAAMASARGWLSRAGTFLFTLLLGLVLVEQLLPWIIPNQVGIHSNLILQKDGYPYTQYDPVYFKKYRPNVQFATQLAPVDGGGSPIIHAINAQGIRGPAIGPKTKGKHRLLLLGDSYIQAIQIPYEQSIGPELQQLLPDSIEIIQHGFPSWSPLLEWNWLLRQVEALEIDEVVLFLYINDFFGGQVVGDSGYTPYTKFNEQGEPIGFDFSIIQQQKTRNPWTLFLAQHTNRPLIKWLRIQYRQHISTKGLKKEALPRLLTCPPDRFARIYRNYLQPDELLNVALWDQIALSRDTSIWTETTMERVALSLRYLNGIQRTLAQRNIRFALTYIPIASSLPGEGQATLKAQKWEGYRLPHQGLSDQLAQYAEEQGIPFLDFYPTFKRYKSRYPDQLLYFPSDGHWTPLGHQQAARSLADFLSGPQYHVE